MRSLVAANWKMYKTRAEARATARELVSILGSVPDGRDVVVFPPFTALASTSEGLAGLPGAAVGGQDVYPAREGAFTGEVSPAMLVDAGASWVLTGHSERRRVLGESPQFVGQKTAFALEQGLAVILCIGETLQERKEGLLEETLRLHLETGLEKASLPEDLSRLVVAYEPVWAIGTGQVASEEDIVDAHARVRTLLKTILGAAGDEIRVLYGGSVKPENARGILGLDNVNGLLVGGASLQAKSFAQIIRADQSAEK